jgi:hypothetical protein
MPNSWCSGDSRLALYDPDGNMISENNDYGGGKCSFLTTIAPKNGRYDIHQFCGDSPVCGGATGWRVDDPAPPLSPAAPAPALASFTPAPDSLAGVPGPCNSTPFGVGCQCNDAEDCATNYCAFNAYGDNRWTCQ